jgi:hypothetical protein
MIYYVRLEVALHGLSAESVNAVIERVDALLRPEFGQRLDGDLEIEAIESASGEGKKGE